MRLTRLPFLLVLGMTGSLCGSLCLGGCVGGSKGITSEEKERLKPYILDAPPAEMQHKIDVNFENRVHIIGYRFDPELAKPSTEVKITYWWRCDDTVDEGWQLFTHLHDVVSDKSDNLDNNGPIRELKNNKQLLGPDRWEKGKVYVDEQTYKMPDWVKGPELTVMVGVWKGDARLRIVTGPNDGDNRAIIGKIKTGLQPPPEPHTESIPSLVVTKLAANDKITIDGKAEEKAWGVAASTGPFVDGGAVSPTPPSPSMARRSSSGTSRTSTSSSTSPIPTSSAASPIPSPRRTSGRRPASPSSGPKTRSRS
jgi:hypothetical protein